MSLTDTHCHLDMDRFDADRPSVLDRAQEAGVYRILIPSLDLGSAARAAELAGSHSALFAAVGIHPTHADKVGPDGLAQLRAMTAQAKVVAIGEVGLDYYWIKSPQLRRQQQAVLQSMLHLASESSLPVVLHMREEGDAAQGACAEDMLMLLVEWIANLRGTGSALLDRAGVLHSFAGTLETARRAIDLGFYIGITGPVTYPRAEARRDVVRRLPVERLLIETDAPFLPPQSKRGKRNEPAFVADIADRIAEVVSMTPKEVARITSANAARLFRWGEHA